MKRFNINFKLIEAIQSLYSKAESAVYSDGKIDEWFHTTTGARQCCVLSLGASEQGGWGYRTPPFKNMGGLSMFCPPHEMCIKIFYIY